MVIIFQKHVDEDRYICPCCGGVIECTDGVETGFMGAFFATAWQNVCCLDCGIKWADPYSKVKRVVLKGILMITCEDSGEIISIPRTEQVEKGV